MVAVSNITEFKIQPTANEKSFLADAQRIREGKSSADSLTCTGKLLELARALLEAYQSDGESGFWKSYDALARENKRLAPFRKSIEAPAAPEEVQEWGKYRPTTLLEMAKKPRPNDIIEDIFYEKTVGELFGAAGTKKSF